MLENSELKPVDNETIIKPILARRSGAFGQVRQPLLINSMESFQHYVADEHDAVARVYSGIARYAQKQEVDFEEYYVFAAFRTETSGSIKVNMEAPVWLDEETILLKLNRESPLGPTTDDMASYAFVYQIHHSVKQLKFGHNTYILAEGLGSAQSDLPPMSDEEREFMELMGL